MQRLRNASFEIFSLEKAVVARAVAADPNATVKIDLAPQTLTTPDGQAAEFPVDGFSKHWLLEGVDELGYILHRAPAIADYEAQHPALINALENAR